MSQMLLMVPGGRKVNPLSSRLALGDETVVPAVVVNLHVPIFLSFCSTWREDWSELMWNLGLVEKPELCNRS